VSENLAGIALAKHLFLAVPRICEGSIGVSERIDVDSIADSCRGGLGKARSGNGNSPTPRLAQ